jgi:hypothetical protein
MLVRKSLACVSLIAFAIAAQPAFAQNGDNAPAPSSGGATNPSTAPAQRTPKKHTGRHRRQQTQQQ